MPDLKPDDAAVLGKTLTAAVAGVPFSARQRHEDLDPLIHEDHFGALGVGRPVHVDRAAITVVASAGKV